MDWPELVSPVGKHAGHVPLAAARLVERLAQGLLVVRHLKKIDRLNCNIDRQIYWQTDRQQTKCMVDRLIKIHITKDGKMERWKDGKIERLKDWKIERQKDRKMERWKDGKMER